MGLLRGTPDLSRKDKKVVGRTSPATPIEVVAAHGSRIRSVDGKRYIDFLAGWGVGNLGWNPPDIVARVHNFEGPTYVAPGMLYEPWVELAEALVDITPGKLAKAYRAVGGTEAVELAMQLALTATGRHKFVAIEGAYHGNSFGARSIVGDALPAHLPGCKLLAPPLDAKALDRLATLLKGDEIAAVILEPVVTNLAVLVPDSELMAGIVELCHEHDTLVIADEIACGFGRTGKLFASELFDFEPDIMTLGKSLTSGVAAMGATLCTNEIAKAAEDELDFYTTYGWHPLAVEAALGTVQYWREHKNELLGNVSARSAEIRHALSIMDWKRDDLEIRIQGLAIGVTVGDAQLVQRITKRCRDHGLLIDGDDDAIVMLPPVIIDEETTQEAMAILEQAVHAG